ncbi:MAG: TolC family protein [Gemmatimonadales bacterium]
MLSFVPILAVGGSLLFHADTVRTRWSLADYLALVESASPELMVARERLTAAEARVGPARRLPDPMVELGLMNRSLPRFGKSSPVAMDQIRISQSIPTPGKLSTATSAARERGVVEANQVEEVRRLVRWRATMDFIELDRLDRIAALLGAFTPSLRSLGDVAGARYAVGEAEQTDVIRAQLETARFAEELAMLDADRQAAVSRLNAMAQRGPEARIDSVVLPAAPDSIPSVAVLVEVALRNRPLLAVRRAARQAADFDRRRAALERWPDLELGLAYGQQPMFDAPGTDRMLSIMVGASLPIWSGSRQRQMRREADALERMAAAEILATRAETEARIGELAAAVNRATRLAALYRGTLVPQSRIAAASALASYRAGGVDFEAVISGQLAVVRSELEVVRLAADRAQALAELEYLTALNGDPR